MEAQPGASRDFDTIFDAISTRRKATIVAEGVPLHPILDAEKVAELAKELPSDARVPTDADIADIAQAFDYDAEEVDATTIILRKRYRDPNDLPFVTFDEVKRSIEEILAITDAYAPMPADPTMSTKVYGLIDSLSPEQKTRAHDGLALADLTSDQRDLALSSARYFVMDNSTKSLGTVLLHLQTLSNPQTVFTWMSLIGGDAFGYQGPFRPDGTTRQFPLNNGFVCSVGGGYKHRYVVTPVAGAKGVGVGVTGKTESALPPNLDHSIPTEQDFRLAKGMLSQRLPTTETLGELTSGLSASSDLKITAEPAIAEKPVCVFGQSCSTGSQIVKDVAAIYGLRVLTTDSKAYRITMLKPQRVDDPDKAGAEMLRLVPAPLTHYYRAQVEQLVADAPKRAVQSDLPPDSQKPTEALLRQGDRYQAEEKAGGSLYFPATRRLLVLALPSVPKRDSPPVRVASVGPEASRLIALIALSGIGLKQLADVGKFMPVPCLMDPQTLCIRTMEFKHPDMQQVQLQFGHKDATGKFVTEGAVGLFRDIAAAPQN